MMVFFIGVALLGGIVIGSHTTPKADLVVIEKPPVQQIEQDNLIIKNLAQ